MERLQCRADALFTRAGNIHRLPSFTSPAWRTASDVLADVPELAANELRTLGAAGWGLLPCVPMVDVFGRRLVALPFDLLCSITGTSGMCAGNTPEEALCHGICEVFERHAIHVLATGRVQGLPTLPLDELRLESQVVQRQIRSIQAAGIELVVKDASLGGAFPVVAVVLTDRRSGTCAVSFGSDPVFDVALSRCLTEAFQGASGLCRTIPTAEGFVRPLDIYNNLETLLVSLTPDVGRQCLSPAFFRTSSNRDALRFVVERTKRAGHRLYVRDCSVFGFPAYYVYVEELSALKELQPAHSASLTRHLQEVRTTLFRLERAAPDEIAKCSRVLFDEMTTCNPTLEIRFGQQVLMAPVASWMGLRPLLSLMLLEAGEPRKARVIAEWPPISSVGLLPATPRAPFVEALAAWLPVYLNTRHEVASPEAIRRTVDTAFGAPPGGVQHDEQPIQRLPVPCCQSVYCCASCPCRQYCRLDDWYRLALHLRDRAVVIEHENLLSVSPSPCTGAA